MIQISQDVCEGKKRHEGGNYVFGASGGERKKRDGIREREKIFSMKPTSQTRLIHSKVKRNVLNLGLVYVFE